MKKSELKKMEVLGKDYVVSNEMKQVLNKLSINIEPLIKIQRTFEPFLKNQKKIEEIIKPFAKIAQINKEKSILNSTLPITESLKGISTLTNRILSNCSIIFTTKTNMEK